MADCRVVLVTRGRPPSSRHPLLGRAGPTCPFVPKALKLSSIRVAVLRVGANPSMDRM